MSASAVFIMDTKGKVIISRNYRGDIPMTASENFTRYLAEEDEDKLTPVFFDGEHSFVYITHNNVIVMAMTKGNANVMMVLAFLKSIVEVLENYFNALNEESIRDNFVITYELLDEMMDFGYPQATDASILKEFICIQERFLFDKNTAPAVVPQALTQKVGWRKEGIVHSKNEIFLDVIEKLNLLVASNGNVISSEIIGSVKMRSFLSGMPELKLGLNDKILMDARRGGAGGKSKGVEMEDIRFHQCVELSRFDSDRTISFIPPDGEFELMSYRLNTQVKPLIWADCEIKVHSSSRVEYHITLKSNFKKKSPANNVEIHLPVPVDADSPDFKTTIGRAEYQPEKDRVVWKIKQLPGGKEYFLRVQIGLPSVTAKEPPARPPLRVEFEIPYFTVSGVQVRYLKITERSRYQASPWVRYITQNGDYEIRL